jgi:hypothetical protein
MVRSSATRAFKAALKASWSSEEDTERGPDDDPIPQDLAKYRPHRPHRPQRLNFQVILAVALFLIIARERGLTDRHL